ncbi:CoA-binding protein [Candidatus Woesearchaeota archaeon]|nr:CoA-binding protein [Candidatus Woesearchaeota archaeon]
MNKNIIDKNFTYAVLGASNNPSKYGYKITKDLKEKGYKVIPINLKENNILGFKAYRSIKECPEKIDVVVFVVPPQITERVLEQVKEMGITKVWMQPGSESKKAIDFCKENNIECIHSMCIMIKSIEND